MKVILKKGRLVLVPQSDEERLELGSWKEDQAGHVLYLHATTTGEGLAMIDLGLKPDACNEPINVTSMSPDPQVKLISNFAHAPFELDGEEYASVEGFWQGLKFEKRADRRRIAELSGKQARNAGEEQPYGESITYAGEAIPVGTWRHWELMERACRAKFTQNDEAREALLATGNRPLTHRVRRDSKSIPGVIMADIWMRIRRSLQGAMAVKTTTEEDEDE
jgi:predicted NAD-dependent protein-ADP-ribosyltransferase YbiA (DUF1768 family)